jgi:hypothetical protein
MDGYIRISTAQKEIWNVTRQQYYKWIKENRFDAVQINHGNTSPYWIKKSSLLDFIETLQQPMAL